MTTRCGPCGNRVECRLNFEVIIILYLRSLFILLLFTANLVQIFCMFKNFEQQWKGCLNLKKVDTFGSNTRSENETKDTDTPGVQ